MKSLKSGGVFNKSDLKDRVDCCLVLLALLLETRKLFSILDTYLSKMPAN